MSRTKVGVIKGNLTPLQRAAKGTNFPTQDGDTATVDLSVGVKPTPIVSSIPYNLWKKITKSNEVYLQELGSKEQRDQFWYPIKKKNVRQNSSVLRFSALIIR